METTYILAIFSLLLLGKMGMCNSNPEDDQNESERPVTHNCTSAEKFDGKALSGLTEEERLEVLYYRQTLVMWETIKDMWSGELLQVGYEFARQNCPTHLLDFKGLSLLPYECK